MNRFDAYRIKISSHLTSPTPPPQIFFRFYVIEEKILRAYQVLYSSTVLWVASCIPLSCLRMLKDTNIELTRQLNIAQTYIIPGILTPPARTRTSTERRFTLFVQHCYLCQWTMMQGESEEGVCVGDGRGGGSQNPIFGVTMISHKGPRDHRLSKILSRGSRRGTYNGWKSVISCLRIPKLLTH